MNHGRAPLAPQTSTQAPAGFPCPASRRGQSPPLTEQYRSSEAVLPPEQAGHHTRAHLPGLLSPGGRRASPRHRCGRPFHVRLGEHSADLPGHLPIAGHQESAVHLDTCVCTFPLMASPPWHAGRVAE